VLIIENEIRGIAPASFKARIKSETLATEALEKAAVAHSAIKKMHPTHSKQLTSFGRLLGGVFCRVASKAHPDATRAAKSGSWLPLLGSSGSFPSNQGISMHFASAKQQIQQHLRRNTSTEHSPTAYLLAG
jgi:hypothetical protein